MTFFILIITLLHELGHFIVARIFNVGVSKFSCGFGKSLSSFKTKNGTVVQLAAIPLGGYVQFAEKEELRSDQILFDDIHPMKKLLVAFAGPLTNYILSFLILIVLYNIVGDSKYHPFTFIYNKNISVINSIFSSKILSNLSSPIGGAKSINYESLVKVLESLASFSVVIGFMNLIPFIFVLDGGHMIIYLYEAIFGLKTKARNIIKYISNIQLNCLMILSVLLIIRDLVACLYR